MSESEHEQAVELTRRGWGVAAAAGVLGIPIYRHGCRNDSESAIYQMVGEASMCWEHPERAGHFDSDAACNVGERLCRLLKSPESPTSFADYRRGMIDGLLADDDLTLGYGANVAAVIHDRLGVSWADAQTVAASILQVILDQPADRTLTILRT